MTVCSPGLDEFVQVSGDGTFVLVVDGGQTLSRCRAEAPSHAVHPGIPDMQSCPTSPHLKGEQQ